MEFTPNKQMVAAYYSLLKMIMRIQNDTDEYLETADSDVLPSIEIKYKDLSAEIPLNLAECNEYITAQLTELKQLYEDIYL